MKIDNDGNPILIDSFSNKKRVYGTVGVFGDFRTIQDIKRLSIEERNRILRKIKTI